MNLRGLLQITEIVNMFSDTDVVCILGVVLKTIEGLISNLLFKISENYQSWIREVVKMSHHWMERSKRMVWMEDEKGFMVDMSF